MSPEGVVNLIIVVSIGVINWFLARNTNGKTNGSVMVLSQQIGEMSQVIDALEYDRTRCEERVAILTERLNRYERNNP